LSFSGQIPSCASTALAPSCWLLSDAPISSAIMRWMSASSYPTNLRDDGKGRLQAYNAFWLVGRIYRQSGPWLEQLEPFQSRTEWEVISSAAWPAGKADWRCLRAAQRQHVIKDEIERGTEQPAGAHHRLD